jgi:hypothetical protein
MTDGSGAEEVAGQRGNAQLLDRGRAPRTGGRWRAGQASGRESACRQVALFRKQAQAIEAVVAAVNVALLTGGRGRENEIALFDDQQEEQPVDQAQQVLVVSFR